MDPVLLEDLLHLMGQQLESAPVDGAIRAPQHPQEALGVDAREIRRAHPARLPTVLPRLHLQQAHLVGPEDGAGFSVDHT